MSIKDLPHVTVEQVLALRKAAIELEKELADLEASLPKVRADAVREAKRMTVLSHNTTNKDYEAGFDDGIDAYDKQLELISELMEAGNE